MAAYPRVQGVFVSDMRSIAWNYLRRWFFLDIAGSFPFDKVPLCAAVYRSLNRAYAQLPMNACVRVCVFIYTCILVCLYFLTMHTSVYAFVRACVHVLEAYISKETQVCEQLKKFALRRGARFHVQPGHFPALMTICACISRGERSHHVRISKF
jgi:hypothetical protein